MPLNIIPNIGQTLAVTRDPIRLNFQSINTAFNVDHVDFGVADQGKHKKVSIPRVAVSPAFGANQMGLFSLLNARTNNSEIYVHKYQDVALGSATKEIPMTAGILGNTGGIIPPSNSQGWTYLPSGILLKWGSIGATAGGNSLNISTAVTGPQIIRILNIVACSASHIGFFIAAEINGVIATFYGNVLCNFLAICIPA